ncbi:Chondroitin sulfate ABC endolyase precursor [Flavobacterium columnare]|uniref:Polysaccharide lyase family 8 super-sandwich domain-containing protein n=2 Tax=Flavobacterium TaxID=237 RepID=A0ABW8PPQ7_9FLAO|nr:polysaccharide lyase family 8 super-sandwich domain-containing protein [Flavobacterium columnare]SPE77381.1 Chondroitin sulfate ABC endolyase precursor [Flavobacterium columnare]
MKQVFFLITALFLTSVLGIDAQCTPTFVPDLALQSSDATIKSEIQNIYDKAKNTRLAATQPSSSSLNTAIGLYNNFNIVVNGNTITGNPITDYNKLTFLNTFVDHLKFSPNDTAVIEKVNNLIWWVSENLCNNTLSVDTHGYIFKNFSRKGFFCAEYLTLQNKQRILYIMEKEFANWNVFWKPTYDYKSQVTEGVINTDDVYNKLDALVPLVKCFPTDDEQYRYMLTLSRFVTRFASVYTDGTRDGIKPDGSGYHHWNNYETYMYAYNTLIYCLDVFDTTRFQIKAPAYKVFRDAVMHKLLISNDAGWIPLSMTGRSGNWETISVDQNSIKNLALVGGRILGLSTADPLLAGIYNKRYGVEPSFNYSTIAPFYDGFYQNNHASAGIFRTKNTVILNKGFSNQLWGAETFSNSNRYGRYQSYGAMNILYPGTADANGFNNTKWDWNYNPGATTKVLSWQDLIVPWQRVDEYSSKKFSGSLQYNLQNKEYLSNVFGTLGMFAMDFQEAENIGWGGTPTGSNTHDISFTFKKSSFFFNDMIICLGSDISNSDVNNSTVTTLYQNATTPNNVIINNNTYNSTGTTSTYSGTNPNWVLDNFNTGFYLVNGNNDLKIQRKNQQTPSHNQNNPTILNPITEAAIGFIDHGKAPNNAQYEYVVVPNTNASDMQNLANSFQNTSTRPYTVLNKDSKAHIIKHTASGIHAFALFEPNTTLPGNTSIISNDKPCLIMYGSLNSNSEMTLSLSNPDLGLPDKRSFDSFKVQPIEITFDGEWELSRPHKDIQSVSSGSTGTVFRFLTSQGLPIEATFKKNITSTSPRIGSFVNNGNAVKAILAYPNPTNTIIRVDNVQMNSTNTKLYNLQGQDLTHLVIINSNTVDMSKLLRGTYWLKVDNQSITVYKK